MSQHARRAIDEELDLEGLSDEDREWHELYVRRRLGKCTCDLVPPLGHVTCPECNESLS